MTDGLQKSQGCPIGSLTFQPSVLLEARQLPLELDAGGEGLEGLELREGARHRLLGGEDGRDGQGPPWDGLGTARLGHDGERVLPEGAQPPDGDGVGVRRVLDEDVRLPAECHKTKPRFFSIGHFARAPVRKLHVTLTCSALNSGTTHRAILPGVR